MNTSARVIRLVFGRLFRRLVHAGEVFSHGRESDFASIGLLVITAGPITKLCAGGGRRKVEDRCYRIRRDSAYVD
jgi:hypothetical protein